MYDDEFYPPPEAPVFEPNEEEFSDPLGYIAKIRPIAEKAGICKVRPPPYWQPPFAIDVENFKFTPRIQRLNELGIQTRIRLQFIQKVAKFWELQGTVFKLPHIGGRPLDLYGLHQVIMKMGGFAEVCKNRQWNAVCVKLGLTKSFAANIKQHYERLLYPYDIMLSGVLIESLDGSGKPFPMNLSGRYAHNKVKKTDATQEADNVKRSKRKATEDPLLVDVSSNKELAKLQLFGAGPKMMGLGLIAKRKNQLKSEDRSTEESTELKPDSSILPPTKIEPPDECKNIFDLMEREEEKVSVQIKSDFQEDDKEDGNKMSTRKKGSEIPYSIIDSIDNCKVCMKDHNNAQLLLCEGCDDSYHTYCLIPPLTSVPKGDWRCPKCLSKECNKKVDPYGFEQARKQYSLQSFGEMADAFKSEYFTKPVHMIPTELVEREFWRLIGSLEEDLAVEYGADIHVLDHGSGFPRLCDKEKHPLSAEEEEYATSGWNLNNLPVAKQSLLSCMSGDISGMKVPWVYVGMCFSAFCWHIEDHWTYSINYLHWGEPKTWYGVPREDAVKLEQVMQNTAPELFKHHPDVLHHLVTTINPATLMNNGVRVVRTNQCAGEFVITFPRAYHAGFNQGYNFAEAVNFCPADWIPVGRQCVVHYRTVKRPCVFSHEEIICKVANDPESLDVQLAAAVYRDMLCMLQDEKELRKKLHDSGVESAEREAFELVPDDERQCYICNTTCFLSAVACPCRPNRLVCMYHISELCDICPPSKFILRYRYTLDELPPMLHKLKVRAESFDTWSCKVEEALARTKDKLTLPDLKDLLEEAAQGKFPENELLHQLQSALREAEKCSRVAHQLVTMRKHRTRLKDVNSGGLTAKYAAGCLLTLDEIRAFYQQLLGLPCTIPNADQVSEYTKRVENFVTQAEMILQQEEPSSKQISMLIDDSLEFDLDLPQIPLLHHALHQSKWLEDVRSCLLLDDDISGGDSPLPLVSLNKLRNLIDSGVSVTPRPAVERAMAELQELLNLSEAWEEKAKSFLDMPEEGSLKTAELISSESRHVPVDLPCCNVLREIVTKANNWVTKLQTIQNQDYYPYLEVLEALQLQAKPMGVKLPQLSIVNTQVEAAEEWKERTSRAFLKKNTLFSLYEVLSPRTQDNKAQQSLKGMRRKIKDDKAEQQQTIEKWAKTDNFNVRDPMDPADVVANFKSLEDKELTLMKDVRRSNNLKSGCASSTEEERSKKIEPTIDSQIYCICKRASSGFMLQCELCHDWFHTACVPTLKFNNNKSKVQQVYELKFLCPLCHRSRRPRLEVILSLLLQLQKLPVRIREGEALQCLTERAMGWQDRARDLLKSPEYSKIVKQLDVKFRESEKIWQEKERKVTRAKSPPSLPADATSDRKPSLDLIDDTIDSVLRRSAPQEEEKRTDSSGVDALLSAASKTDTEREDVMEAAEVLAMIACSSHHTNTSPHRTNDGLISNHITQAPSTEVAEKPSDVVQASTSVSVKEEEDPAVCDPILHGANEKGDERSAVDDAANEERLSVDPLPVPPTFNAEDSKLQGDLPREIEIPSIYNNALIELPSEMKKALEQLMMEGDLLEVTLDETQQIWKILQASQPINDDKFQELWEVEEIQGSRAVIDDRKRKKEEPAISVGAEKKKKRQRSLTDTNIASKEIKKNEKKKKKKSGIKQSALDALVALDDDEYAFCAVYDATNGVISCQQPTGEEVDWLQCDGGCEGWFHCVCVSVSAQEARELDYVCERCAALKISSDSANMESPDSLDPLARQDSVESMETAQSGTSSACPGTSAVASTV